MDLTLALWLFGACFAAIGSVLGFAWHCNVARDKDTAKLREELFTYKVHVAEHFSTVTSTVAIERRMVDSLDEIKKTLRSQSEKLDRIVESREWRGP